MKSFTIQEIRNYITSQDSLGDVLWNLSEESIEKVNQPVNTSSEAYLEGRDEYVSGEKYWNPYREDLPEYKEYAAGWNSMYANDESMF